VPNSAGGHAWQIDDWDRLERFLILGSEGGTYYASERKITADNVDVVRRCLKEDGIRTVNWIAEISESGRAPKNTPAIFALAMAAAADEEKTRQHALAQLSRVCRIGTHLFQFASFVKEFRGWGPTLRRSVGEWYTEKDPEKLAYQLIKYRQREGWSHPDLLRLSHPVPPETHASLLRWAVRGEGEPGFAAIEAFARLQAADTESESAALIREYGSVIPREAIKPEHLGPEVWEMLLLAGMPLTALIRNLATMTRNGVLKPMNSGSQQVVAELGNTERLRRSRVHPIAVLSALATYQSGHGARGRGEGWAPVPEIVDALDKAFYEAFGNVTPSGKRTMLALDVSSSMTWGQVAGVPGLNPRVASAAMAMVTVATEPLTYTTAFCHELVPVTITKRERLDDVLKKVDALSFGGTDCSLPMLHAIERGIDIDTFVVYTDSETWAGRIHPSQALQQYRDKTGIPAKLIVVGMEANPFSIADPNDPGMLDVIGFDTAAPQVMADFARG
jgi:60 kDa SS-A/Ro ribonucleoprotein